MTNFRDSLDGKVAFITGGASGIGRATAEAFAARGAKVVIADMDATLGRETAANIVLNGADAIYVALDVRQASSVEDACNEAARQFGRIDCAINAAGIMSAFRQRMADIDEVEWDRIIDINLKGVWLSMKYELQHMLKNGGGSIVNIASIAGLRGGPAAPIYSASKHGVIGLTKSAALQYATDGIRVNAVCPGFIETPMLAGMKASSPELVADRKDSVPMKRLGNPKEIAETVIWLCLASSSYTTGASIVVDGGCMAT